MMRSTILGLGVGVLVLAGCGEGDDKGGDTATGGGGGENRAPQASIDSHTDGAALDAGTTVSFAGTVGDADHMVEALQVTWYLGDEAVCGPSIPDADGSTDCTAEVGEGDDTVVLQAVDPDGAVGTARVSLAVEVAASAPTAEITSPSQDDRIYADDVVIFSGLLADAEDAAEVLTAAWTSDRDGALSIDATPDAGGRVEGSGSLSEGDHTLTLTVTDTDAMTGTDTVTVTVRAENSAPTCAWTAPADGGAAESGTPVTLAAIVGDVDQSAETLSLAIESDLDGVLSSEPPAADGAVSEELSTLSIGAHTLTLTVTDERDAMCVETLEFTVGTAPVVAIDRPTDGDVVDEGASVEFAATVFDGEEDPDALSLSWESDLDGVLDTGAADASGSAGFSTAALSRGAHTVTLTVTDSDGLSSSTALGLTINGVPSAASVTLSPDPATTSDDLVATASGSTDPEGDPVTYAYVWSVDGSTSSASTTDTLPASATARGETWTVTVTPSDGTTTGPTGSASLTIANTDPVLSSVSVSPSTGVLVDDTLVCSASATDADGDAITYTYAWTVDGIAAGSAVTLDLDAVGAAPGDSVTCTVTATDGAGGTAEDAASVTVDNRAPTVDTLGITPSSGVTTSTTLTCAATASDADGETPTISYAWTAGATSLGGGATLALAPSVVSPGDTVTCTATATDGAGHTGSDTASVAVDNTDPVVDSVSITPSTGVLRGDTVTCAVTASDADGGSPTIAYAWTDDAGASLGSTAALTVPSTFAPGDGLTCTVTVSDSDGGAATDSASVTVDNDAPTVSGVTIAPDPATVTDTLTCSWTYADTEGDAEASAVSWTVGGTEVGTSTTLSSGFAAGDTVTCAVTPHDGHDAGTAAAASLTIDNSVPTVSTVEIDATEAWVGDTLTCSWSFSDDDGDADASTVSWTLADGTEIGTASTLSSGFVGGDAVTCTVTPGDGTDTGTAVSSTALTISNTAPTAPEIEVTPADPVVGDDLLCSVRTASTDADGDTLTTSYSWSVDGSAASTYDGLDTVPASATSEGEVWACAVTVDDGTDTTTASADVTICTPTTMYVDGDGDGYGDSGAGSADFCDGDDTTGYALVDGDCDDTDADINPGAYEACDGVDNDCDGTLDPTDEDADGDGWTTCDGDCDDTDVTIRPDMPEICGDLLDNDCDGDTDVVDADGDGYGGCGDRASREDCNDHSDRVHPGATEIDGDELDNDCDGEVDDPTVDNDGDGYSEDAGDCDDAAPWVHPAAVDIPDTEVDEDCDGVEEYASDLGSAAIYADPDAGSDYFPGTPDYPVATLTQAVTLAAAAGYPVIAAEGTYAEDLSATVDVFGGYAPDWSGVTGYSTLVGDLSASSDIVVAGLEVEGWLGTWGSAPVFYDGAVYADGSTAYAVYAVSGYLTIAESRIYGPDSYAGTSYAARFANEGNVWNSVVVGGTAGAAGDGANGSHWNDDCFRVWCDGSYHGPENYCGDAGEDGRSAVGVTTIEGTSDLILNGSLIVGGLAADGGAGGNGYRGRSHWVSCCGQIAWGGGPGGDGGDGGDVVIVDVSSGAGFVVGSHLTGGQPGDGGDGGDGGDAGSSTSGADNGRGGNGGNAGDGGSWVGVVGPASVYGSQISWSGTPTTGGVGGARGADTGTCTRTSRWIYHEESSFNPRAGSSGSGIDSFIGLDLDSTTSDEIVGNTVDIGAAGTGADYTALSVADGLVARNIVYAEADGEAIGIAATGTVELVSNLVAVDDGSTCVGIESSGEDTLFVNNTVVVGTAGTGLSLAGSHMRGLVNNLVQTASGGTCIHDTTSTRDYMLNNLVDGCTGQLYLDGTGYRTLAAELDFITVTTDAGDNQLAAPEFTDASAGDYSLQSTSPAIDAGYDVSSSTFGAVSVDVFGDAAPAGSTYDIGATEQ